MKTLVWQSPLGPIHLAASERGLAAVAFPENWREVKARLPALEKGENEALKAAVRQLEEYFAGARTEFTVPLDLQGTAFQKSAWAALLRIPYGKTFTYGQQAREMKRPKAVRAVGAANGRNPVCILVPCHRVIGADGSLTGYAGGMNTKRALLELEGYGVGKAQN